MTLEDRLEHLATRTQPGDPAEVLAAARARAGSRNRRAPRSLLAAAPLVLAVVAAGAFAVLRDGDDTVTVAGRGPDSPVHRPDPDGGTDGPVLYAPRPESDATEQALVVGRLVRHGECLFAEPETAADGPGLLILWPYGTRWDAASETVVVPDGLRIPVGSTFTAAGGGLTVDMLHRAGHHPDVVTRAGSCASGTSPVAFAQGDFDVAPSPALSVPTYDLLLSDASLIEDNPHTASNTDVVLWSDGNGAYMSLTVRPGRPGSWVTPGAGATVTDETFPEGQGEAWFSEPEDPRVATMWWVRPSGDLWLLNGYWYGDSVPESAEAALRDWALGIVHDPAADRSYLAEAVGLSIVASEDAGDRPSRSRVWEYDGEEIVLLVNEASSAAGLSNMLARGAPIVTDVPGIGEVWSVGTTYGWAVTGEGAWATLTVPDPLAERAPEILAALRPTRG